MLIDMKKLLIVFTLILGVFAAIAQDEKTAVDFKNEGNDALRDRDFKTALELFEKAIAEWDQEEADYAMIYNAGFCAYQVKQFEKAIGFFNDAISHDYRVANAYLYVANSYRQLGNDAEYEATLLKGLEAEPEDDKMKEMLATFYLREGNKFYRAGAKILQDAAADISAGKYTTNDDQYKEAEANAAVEFKKALPYFEKALELNPDNATGKQLYDACKQMIKG